MIGGALVAYAAAVARGARGAPRAGGQGLVEYGLIIGGIAAVAVVTLLFFGDQVAAVLDFIGNLIDQATNA